MVITARELLKDADKRVRRETHPTLVISGYRLACKEAVHYISENLIIKTIDLRRDCLIHAAKTSMSSKVIRTKYDSRCCTPY